MEKMIKGFHVLGEYKIGYVLFYDHFFEIEILLIK